MGRTTFYAVCAAAAVCSISCASLSQREEEKGIISVELASSLFRGTKSSVPGISTEDFILDVEDADGGMIYHGKYGLSPEEFEVSAGSYKVSASSDEFKEPEFDTPVFGDTRIVLVNSGQRVSVTLECAQTNCGLHLNVDHRFRTVYPDGYLYLDSEEGGLMYGYDEGRTAFFLPGDIRISLGGYGQEKTKLSTVSLNKRQMLTLSLSASDKLLQEGAGIDIQLDTSRIWSEDEFVAGEEGSGDSSENARSVTNAIQSPEGQGVWVFGYIVGVATGSSSYQFEGPFGKETNILLGARASTTESRYCISVELPKGTVRDAVNLMGNPNNLCRKIRMKGNLVPSYFGLPGLKSVSDYSFE